MRSCGRKMRMCPLFSSPVQNYVAYGVDNRANSTVFYGENKKNQSVLKCVKSAFMINLRPGSVVYIHTYMS